MVAIGFGYFTAFKKIILDNIIQIPIEINPPIWKRIFKKEKKFTAIVNFDLIRAYKIHFFCIIPIFWKRMFFLYNKTLNIYYKINEELENQLDECKDNNEEYHKVIKKFFNDKKKNTK